MSNNSDSATKKDSLTAFNLTFKEYYDMLKHGSYIAVKPDEKTCEQITEICKKLKLKSCIKPEDLHVTLMYSDTRGIPEFFPYPNAEYKAVGFKLEVWEDTLVIRLISPDLHARFNDLSYRGFKHSFEQYNPHISLSYEYSGEKLDNSLVDGLEMTFTGEYHCAINVD